MYKTYTIESIGGESNREALYIETNPTDPKRNLRTPLTITLQAQFLRNELRPTHKHLPRTSDKPHSSSEKQVATIIAENRIYIKNNCCPAVPPPKSQLTHYFLGSRLMCGEWLRDVELVVQKGIYTRVDKIGSEGS